jgi:hypothetical protein
MTSKLQNGSVLSVTEAVKGQLAKYRCNEMLFPVRVLDARKVYGRTDALITPVGGSGETWVEAGKLILSE